MKKLLFLAITLVMAISASAQEKKVAEFEETTHNFGVIKEEDGRVSYVFEFKNATQAPLTIKNVRASCGCTTPNWSKEPIAPEGNGKITVTYNAKGRPGAFHKSITVTLSNGTEDFTQMLYIKGQVTPAVPKPEENPAE